MREDGKDKNTLLLFALLGGVVGAELFYVKKMKLAAIKLGISWLGATLIVAMWIIYATWFATDDNFWNVVVALNGVGGALLGISLVWSLYNVFLIIQGQFKDENNVPIKNWNSTKEEFIEYLIRNKGGK